MSNNTQALEEISTEAAKIDEAIERAKKAVVEIENSVSKVSKAHGRRLAKAFLELERLSEKMEALGKVSEVVGDYVKNSAEYIARARGYMTGVCDIIGKPVQLKSGGVAMTAAGLADDGSISCFWFADQVMQQQNIPLAALDIAGDRLSPADMRKMLINNGDPS